MPGTDRPTHYEILAVDPRADADQIREAYRRLARDHHPDRVAMSGSDGRSMPQINEAYRVLSDPARRAVYDASLRSPGPVERGESSVVREPMAHAAPPVTPARIPWRSLLVVGVIALIGLVVIAQFSESPTPAGPDGILRIGECVTIDSAGFARETTCTGDVAVDQVVVAVVPFGADCPTGARPHQDRQGLGIACVEGPTEIPG